MAKHPREDLAAELCTYSLEHSFNVTTAAIIAPDRVVAPAPGLEHSRAVDLF